MNGKLSLDLGCGPYKRPGFIGVDIDRHDGVDHVLDLTRDRLPFDDDSVGQVYSSHCIEHLPDLDHVFREITRVCVSGATIELWHPHSMHAHAFLQGHRLFLNEVHYYEIGSRAPQYWSKKLGARWIVNEVVYAIPGEVLTELTDAGIDVDFAVRFLNNVVVEIGAFVVVDKEGPVPERAPLPRRLYTVSRKRSDYRPIEPVRRGWPFASRLRRYLRL